MVRVALSAVLALLLSALSFGAAPVLDDPIPAAGEAPKVDPVIPIAKALLFPVTAYDDDGDPLSITVTSSNPKIMARVKTGNPLLKLSIDHASGASDPAYSGDLVFQLFRDWTPETAGFISGFAQGGLYKFVTDVFTVTTVGDIAGSLGGKYFECSDYLGTVRVWLDVDNTSTAPATPSGGRRIEVDIATDATAAQVAAAVAAALEADQSFAAMVADATVTVTASTPGGRRAPSAGISGFTVTRQIVGKSAGFHRFANLAAGSDAESFIYQGGDPLGDGTGGPGMIANLPQTAFKFENEFRAPLIFSGRGQLAMANSGTDQSNYVGTNGSQFFITHGNLPAVAGAELDLGGPRHLDFNHTIFAQLTHGWDLLEMMHDTPTTSSKPTKEVFITDAEVIDRYVVADTNGTHTYTDAVLVLTATAPGTATITVKVDDGNGGVVTKSFTATAVADTNNSPPFYIPPFNVVGPRDQVFAVLLPTAVDLEFDYLLFASGLVDSPARGQSEQRGDRVFLLANSGYEGPMKLAFGLTQFDPSYRGTIDGPSRPFDDLLSMTIGIGDKRVSAEPLTIFAEPGVAFTDKIVAKFVDSDTRGGAGTFTARINWGDGTPIDAGIISKDTSRPVFSGAVVKGSHTYAHPGIYTVGVELTGNKGFKDTIRRTAVVTAGPLRADGETLLVRGKTVSKRVLATFTDSGAPVAASQYEATIDWGDGKVSPGIVKAKGAGKFAVLGVHTYEDAETFSIGIRIHKIGSPAAEDALAWSRIAMDFKSTPHLPPFAQAHLIGEITALADSTLPTGNKPIRATTGFGATSQTFFTCQMIVVNSGNLTSKPGKLRFYLSRDRELNLTAEGENPADIPLKVGTFPEFQIPALKPGAGIRYICDKGTIDTRLRAPQGENGTGQNLLGAMIYSDPIADHEPIDRAAVEGPFNGITVTPISIQITEAAGDKHSQNFTVSIDRQPATGKVVVIKVANGNPLEATLSATTLTFTDLNWQTPQNVTVTAIDDNTPDGDKSFTLSVTLDKTATTDTLFHPLEPSDVSVSSVDDEPRVIVAPTTLTLTEAAGSGHSRTFNVRFDQLPTADVTIALINTNMADVTIDKTSLTFTPTNATTAQTVTVTAVEDDFAEGPHSVTIVTNPAVSTDARFSGANGADVTANITDND